MDAVRGAAPMIRLNSPAGDRADGNPWRWDAMLDSWERVYRAGEVTAADRIFFAFSFGMFLGFWTAFDAAARIGAMRIPGGGMSSALFQEIREKNGLAYTVYSTLTPYFDTGVFSIYAATNASQVSTCLKLIDEVIAKVCRDLLTDEELSAVKENLKGTILLSRTTSSRACHHLRVTRSFMRSIPPSTEFASNST